MPNWFFYYSVSHSHQFPLFPVNYSVPTHSLNSHQFLSSNPVAQCLSYHSIPQFRYNPIVPNQVPQFHHSSSVPSKFLGSITVPEFPPSSSVPFQFPVPIQFLSYVPVPQFSSSLTFPLFKTTQLFKYAGILIQ
jgi:hypothetical protein